MERLCSRRKEGGTRTAFRTSRERLITHRLGIVDGPPLHDESVPSLSSAPRESTVFPRRRRERLGELRRRPGGKELRGRCDEGGVELIRAQRFREREAVFDRIGHARVPQRLASAAILVHPSVPRTAGNSVDGDLDTRRDDLAAIEPSAHFDSEPSPLTEETTSFDRSGRRSCRIPVHFERALNVQRRPDLLFEASVIDHDRSHGFPPTARSRVSVQPQLKLIFLGCDRTLTIRAKLLKTLFCPHSLLVQFSTTKKLIHKEN